MGKDSLYLLLKSFNLSTISRIYKEAEKTAERENWSYIRYLEYLCENEYQCRHERKIQRLLKKSNLPDGKTLSSLDESLLPQKCKKLLPSILEGGFVERAENILVFGLPGGGKTHFLAALGFELILRHQYKVLFIPTYKLVQELLAAKNKLELPELLRKFNTYDVIIMDDIGYIQHSKE